MKTYEQIEQSKRIKEVRKVNLDNVLLNYHLHLGQRISVDILRASHVDLLLANKLIWLQQDVARSQGGIYLYYDKDVVAEYYKDGKLTLFFSFDFETQHWRGGPVGSDCVSYKSLVQVHMLGCKGKHKPYPDLNPSKVEVRTSSLLSFICQLLLGIMLFIAIFR